MAKKPNVEFADEPAAAEKPAEVMVSKSLLEQLVAEKRQAGLTADQALEVALAQIEHDRTK